MDELRILLADDHLLLGETLAAHLEAEKGLRVVARSRNGEEAIQLAREHRPDIMLLDIEMPGLSGFEAARAILARRPDTRIIFLSAYTYDRHIEEALKLGALGYLTKSETPEQVVHAIREVAANRVCYSQEVLDRIVFDGTGPRLLKEGKPRSGSLTTRELEILRHIASGLANKGIAQIVHLSAKTVDKHTENIMRKLNIHDRVSLTRYAIREGLVALDC